MTVPRLVEVTQQQRAVVGELARDGASTAVIAERLGYTAPTVRSVISRVMQVAGCETRTALAVALLRGHLKLRTVDRRTKARVIQ